MKMPNMVGAHMRFRHLLVAVGLVAACAVAGVAAGPANATNEYFECGAYKVINGPENWVSNTQGINHSGTGSCSVVWNNIGGGKYKEEAFECAEGGGTETACSFKEFKGHGEVETSAGPSFLRGRQDNFTGCG